MSPSGRYISAVQGNADKSVLFIVDMQSGDVEPRTFDMGDMYLNWVEWATDDRLILSVTGYINYRTGKQMSRADLEELERYEWPAPYTRIISMDRDGSTPATMFQDDGYLAKNYRLGEVVSFLPDQPDHILMAAPRLRDLDLFKVNIQDGSFQRIAEGTKKTFRWYVDRDGEPAFRYDSNNRATRMTIYAREDRQNGKIKWRKIKTIRMSREGRADADPSFHPLFAGPTATTFYVRARPEGEDKAGIYLYDFEQDAYVDTVHVNPEFDMLGAIFNRDTGALQAVTHDEDQFVIAFEDPETQAQMEDLTAYFDDKLTVFPIRSNADGTRWLIETTGPTDAGSYYYYDSAETRIQLFGNRRVNLATKTLADTDVVRFVARDGLALMGYLTRPVSAAPGDRPPLIVLPHGGPEVRDRYGYDPMVQILAARGYQVFQPNFRGSDGFGRAFAALGHRQWGKDMQTDIEDGFAHLVETGLADAQRACILGGSYGGYAALAAATLTPDLYQCVIAIAAPSDLLAQLRYEREEEGSSSVIYKYWVQQIGDPGKDRSAIREVSPAKRADQVTQPILLIHGKHDQVVPFEQMEFMAKALNRADKPFAQIVLEDSMHSFRTEEDKRKEYAAILDFLAAHLPVDG